MFLSQLKWLNFLGQNDSNFFSKKISHFDLKSLVTSGTKIRSNFLGQNDSIFVSVHREKKYSHFDVKSWVTGGIKI